MQIRVLEHTKKKIIFELEGADHTFCNSLKEELYKDDNTKIATYSIAHPLIRIPKFIVESNGQKEPTDLLKAASKKLIKINDEFLSNFKKAK